MNSFFLIVFPTLLWGSLSAFILFSKTADNPTLKLVHVLFRHGNRNPDQNSLIPGTKYYNASYYPEGFGQLIQDGYRTEYAIGNALRNRYTDFLTNEWNINDLEVSSTNVDRTKMSVELMLAGLYPPRGDQIWSLLFWQPIPYSYDNSDKTLNARQICYSRYSALYDSVLSDPGIVSYLTRYDKLFKVLDEHTGGSGLVNIETAFGLYFGFATQSELGYELEPWMKTIYPEPIHSAAVDYYYLTTNNTLIRRITAGYQLKKILSDTANKINGTISPSGRKMFIYSAHEFNVATMLLSMDAFDLRDPPAYGSYILWEVHEVDGIWGIKLFYQDYKQDDPVALKLPGCDYFCSYDNFYSMVKDILPTEKDC